jgi:hypothetical protein
LQKPLGFIVQQEIILRQFCPENNCRILLWYLRNVFGFSSVQTKSENRSGPELRHHLIPEKHTKIENVKDDQKIKIQ